MWLRVGKRKGQCRRRGSRGKSHALRPFGPARPAIAATPGRGGSRAARAAAARLAGGTGCAMTRSFGWFACRR